MEVEIAKLRLWATAIKHRDGKCMSCGVVKENRRLLAHHIVPTAQGGKNTMENGITLCTNCHKRVHVASSDLYELYSVLFLYLAERSGRTWKPERVETKAERGLQILDETMKDIEADISKFEADLPLLELT